MATTDITWSDTSVSAIDYTGEGSEALAIGHSANEGLDRTATATISVGDGLQAAVSLLQYGLREMLVTSDGYALAATDGTLAALKDGDCDRLGESSATTHALGYDSAQITNILNKIDQWQT